MASNETFRRRPPATIDLAAADVTPGARDAPAASDDGSEERQSAGISGEVPPSARKSPLLLGALVAVVASGATIGMLLLAISQRRDFDALTARLARVESELRSQPTDRTAIDGLSARLARLEAAPRSDPALADRVAALETKPNALVDLDQRIDNLAGGMRELRARLDSVGKALEDLGQGERARNADEFERLAARVTALENATRSVESDLASTATASSVADRDVRIAVLAAALRSAVERGQPFVSELAALKSMVDAARLAALEPFARGGVPDAAALAGELSALLPALREAQPQRRDGSLLARLQESADRLVRVRPLDAPLGDEPSAIIARLEVKAARFDIAGALDELAKLPVAAPAAAWIAKATARQAAVATAQHLAADALAALGKS